jgi:phosphoribosylanthranilate isomerase
MSGTLIKICGITRMEDGLAALEAGADWLGFIRWPGSKRFQDAETCAKLIQSLRARAPRPFEAVGVYVDMPAPALCAEARSIGLDRVQLHGPYTMEDLALVDLPAIKSIAVSDAASLAEAERFPGVDLLTDAHDPALHGGTGRGYDYGLLRGLTARRRVIVAGGLDAANVGEVVRLLRPWGVDVSSRIESAPGIKDHDKIRAFIRAVRAAGSE